MIKLDKISLLLDKTRFLKKQEKKKVDFTFIFLLIEKIVEEKSLFFE